jgi:glycosyltransferase involved in cell wall biosynthesis
LYRQTGFDIVQTFFPDANIFGVIAARLAGCRHIVASRRNIGHWHDRAQVRVLRLLRHWTHHYLANSIAAAEKTVATEGIDRSRIEVIYNGLELSRFRQMSPNLRAEQRRRWGLEADHTLIGLVANLRPVKNIPSFITAIDELRADFPHIRGVVVGEGPLRPELQAMIAQKNLTDIVTLAGRHEDIGPCLAAFDMAVLCSDHESFSNSLIEYMAAGLPAVASDVGGAGEAIRHGVTGLLYDAAAPRGLAGELRKLLETPELALRLGRQAQADASDRYSRESILRAYADYYEKIVAGA